MGRLPPLNALKAFEVAARHSSFKDAANEMHITPSAVSRHIRLLEDAIGLPLFERHNRKVELTAAGSILAPALTAGFDDIARTVDLIRPRDRRQQPEARLTLRVDPAFASGWLIERMGAYRRAFPRLELEVILDDNPFERLAQGCDAAVVHVEGTLRGDNTTLLLRTHVFPVCSPELMTGQKPLRTPGDLIHHNLLHEGSTRWWGEWLKSAMVRDIDWASGTIIRDSAMCLKMAMNGDGVAVGDDLSSAHDLIVTGRLVKPFAHTIRHSHGIYIVTPPGRDEDPRIAGLREWMLAEMESHLEMTAPLRQDAPYPA